MSASYSSPPDSDSLTNSDPADAKMDRDFIARNHIVERYLAGTLPPKGASDFERFIRANPALIDELGLADRIHCGLRLLEFSGKPEPWAEQRIRFWQRLPFVSAIAAVAALLLAALSLLGGKVSDQANLIAKLRQEVIERPILPTSSVRPVIVFPGLAGAASAARVNLTSGEMTELKIDVTQTRHSVFRVILDRVGHGRVAILDNMIKDSNSHVRLQLNPSAFGAGEYLLTLERLNLRREGTPSAWVRLNISP
ncbi:MAG: hypothetical protein KDI32_01085 [Pseudomonadales bacterium]|jgi:hypothetical protein|nr:hypothetical protein [Pseudomonadales bacterium]